MEICGRVWKDVAECGRMRQGVEGCVWKDVAGCGRVWKQTFVAYTPACDYNSCWNIEVPYSVVGGGREINRKICTERCTVLLCFYLSSIRPSLSFSSKFVFIYSVSVCGSLYESYALHF